MKKIFSILFALVLVVGLGLTITAPVVAEPGATYYVSTTGDDDTGDGTVGNPWRTIQKAVDALNVTEDGDTITVAAGEYDAFIVEGKANINIISTEGATVATAVLVPDLGGPIDAAWVMAAVYASENINIEGINFDATAISEAEPICGIAYVDSTGSVADLTVENIFDPVFGAGVAIIGEVGSSTVEITGATISHNNGGIYALDSTLDAHFNNIAGNTYLGVGKYGSGTADVTHNWWGDPSGPYHESLNPGGGGDEISGIMDFEPWLEVGVLAAKTETVIGGGTVDATDEADTEVVVDGTATVTAARYEDNPGGDPPTDFNALDKYIDVYIPDPSGATEIEIRLYYTDAELAAVDIDEESLRLFWWDDTAWVQCSDSGVNTASTNGYSGYMWARIRNDTTPSLADLQGDEFGGYGGPSELPDGCGCFIATAAYGTDTAEQLDILREFRDTVLLPNSLGAKFVSLYYKASPPIADFISQNEVLRTMVRVGFVDPIARILTWTHDLWST